MLSLQYLIENTLTKTVAMIDVTEDFENNYQYFIAIISYKLEIFVFNMNGIIDYCLIQISNKIY